MLLRSLSLRCVVALGAVLIFAGCSSAATKTSSSSTTRAASHVTAATSVPTITIENFSFGDPITISPGATVTVRNTYTETHSLSSDDGLWDTSGITPGSSATFVAPDKPGTYKFHCNFHANMHGSLIVAS